MFPEATDRLSDGIALPGMQRGISAKAGGRSCSHFAGHAQTDEALSTSSLEPVNALVKTARPRFAFHVYVPRSAIFRAFVRASITSFVAKLMDMRNLDAKRPLT